MRTAYSIEPTPAAASKDLQDQLAGFNPSAILFFASSAFDPHILSRKMQEAFSDSVVFGCTTAGEIVSGRMLKRSVVAMAFGPEVIDRIELSVIEDVSKGKCVDDAIASFETSYKEPMLDMDPSKYVGIILIDGLSKAEERLIDRIGDLTNVSFIGGSAGDDMEFKATHIFAGGKAYPHAALLALLKPNVAFDTIKTQSFCALGKELLATKVNEPEREVLEFDGKPAALAYAEAIGASVEEAARHFMSNPVGLMIDGEPYVRSPQQIKGDSMIFYCNVKERMKLSVLQSTDIVEETRRAVEDKKKQIGAISGILNFHCILRTLELEDKGQTEDYGKIFDDIPTIGFSTYGEQCIGHVNQTSTMLVFKGGK